MLLPILRGLAANIKTVDRTVVCLDDFPLDPSCECMQIRLTGSSSQPPLQLIILKSPKTHITKLASRWMVMVVVYRKSVENQLALAF